MNTIIINSKEFEEILALGGTNNKNYDYIDFDYFIFDEYKIVIKSSTKIIIKVKLLKESDKLIIKLNNRIIIKSNNYLDIEMTGRRHSYNYVEVIDLPNTYDLMRLYTNMGNDSTSTMLTSLLMFVSCLMYYIMNEIYNRKEVIKEVEKTEIKRGKTIKNQTDSTPITQFLLKDLIKYERKKVASKGKHDMKCECWGVRGHFRHYKSGKTVWVESYEKGSKRNTGKDGGRKYKL